MILVTVSTGFFDPLISACDELRTSFDFFGQIGSSAVVPHFPYERQMAPEKLDAKMAEAELVISHAGTGMLSRLYQLQKRVIVVPKQIRYGEANDGQVELALKWAELGMAVLCLDVSELAEKIMTCRITTPKFPIFPSLGKALIGRFGISPSTVAEPLSS